MTELDNRNLGEGTSEMTNRIKGLEKEPYETILKTWGDFQNLNDLCTRST